jgi:hypothetical protein
MSYYVTLTGGKNNAGDFLIKHCASNLLKEFRTDRELVDLNAWEPFDNEKLEIVNKSNALLLTGGPALQYNMYPSIYKLTDDLNKIKVPIISMGIGWKSLNGDWNDIKDYKLSRETKKLVARMAESGYQSSIRDYHTRHVLEKEGMDNVLMTGCPALYSSNHIGKRIEENAKPKKVYFSLGVGFAVSLAMEQSVKEIVLKLKESFSDAEFSVKFHHSVDKSFFSTPGANSKLYYKNVEFEKWLETMGIDYEDISGSAENLINCYRDCDFHIGYRVHAHIFMSSISMPSILLAEDGRGRALKYVMGGVILDSYVKREDSLIKKVAGKVGLNSDPFVVDDYFPELLISTINSEFNTGMPRLKSVRNNIDLHFNLMKVFINQLP